MKKGLWIGGLFLALWGQGSRLLAEDVEWRAVSAVPATQTAAAALTPPEPLPIQDGKIKPVPSPLAAELLPVSYEASPVVAEQTAAPRPGEIIAVSAPVKPATLEPSLVEEESSESLFAVDRPLRPIAPIRRTSGQVGGTTAATPGSPPDVPMVPGWEAPVDASWGMGKPVTPALGGADGGFGAGVNPLRPRLYVGGEYLLWWLQGYSTPVLATTSSPSDFGVLGAPTTQTLFGGNSLNGNSPFSGGRFTFGYWFGCEQKMAGEFTFFFLGPRSSNFYTDSATNPVIGRPFQEANNGQETAQLTSLPGVSAGALTIQAPTFLYGFEGNLRCILCCGCNYRISALAGFRNLNLNDRLSITENVLGLATAPAPFTNQTITVNDTFSTQNHFYGGQVGLDALWFWGRFSIEARGKVALGDTVQLLDINGSQRFVSPTGMVQNFTGGLLALPSNIGHFSNNAFSVVPEVGVNLGYQILPYLRGFVGYNFLYWSNVIRPGTSIDRSLDVTQIPNFPLNPEPAPVPGRHPAPVFQQEGFWAQGITFGLEFFY